MADAKQSETERFAAGLWSAMKERAAGAARVYGPGSNNKELSPEEEVRLWNTRTKTLEQEWELWRQGLTPEEIGLQVFGHREKLIKSGGRLEPDAWAKKIDAIVPRARLAREAQEQQAQAASPSLAPQEGGY